MKSTGNWGIHRNKKKEGSEKPKLFAPFFYEKRRDYESIQSGHKYVYLKIPDG